MSHLFGHLANKFSHSPEDLATEALHYILESDPAVLGAFIGHVNDVSGADLNTDLRLATQKDTEHAGRPDMVGWERQSNGRLFVEAKFWAGFTDNQPAGYLRELAGDGESSVLLFLVPERRKQNVWRHVVKQIDVSRLRNASSPLVTPAGTHVAITTWTDVLAELEPAAMSLAAEGLVNDVQQLRGLCHRQNAEAFRPFRGRDFAPEIARRILDMRDVVDALQESVRSDPIQGWEYHSSARGKDKTYRFVTHLHGQKAGVGLMYWWWFQEEGSPFWIRLHTDRPDMQSSVFNALRPDYDVTEGGRYRPLHSMIPIPAVTGASFDQIIVSFRDDLTTIADSLQHILAPAS